MGSNIVATWMAPALFDLKNYVCSLKVRISVLKIKTKAQRNTLESEIKSSQFQNLRFVRLWKNELGPREKLKVGIATALGCIPV